MNKPEKENYTHKQIYALTQTTVLCLRTHALMLAVPVFNTADAIMPSCRKQVSRHFQPGISPPHTAWTRTQSPKRLLLT